MHPGQRLKRFIVENKSFLIFVGLMLMFRSAVADWMYVPSGSMNPTIVEGDRVLVDKAAYGWRIPFTTVRLTPGSDPERGDIVIFTSPEDGETLIKRVVGLPGDSVEMRNEHVLVNGKELVYAPADLPADPDLPAATRAQTHTYASENLGRTTHAILLLPQRTAARSFGPVTVPLGEYLMLGDSRDNSKDSRYIGFVPRASIFGRAHRVAFSLDPDRWYRPRGDRLFSPLN